MKMILMNLKGSLISGNKINLNQAVKDWLDSVRFGYSSKKGGAVCALHDLSGFLHHTRYHSPNKNLFLTSNKLEEAIRISKSLHFDSVINDEGLFKKNYINNPKTCGYQYTVIQDKTSFSWFKERFFDKRKLDIQEHKIYYFYVISSKNTQSFNFVKFLEEQKIQNCLSRVLSAEDILTLPPKKNFHKIS